MFLFPDTNFFLHFRDASELPWHEILPGEDVCLVVCRTVQREIDRKKHELRGRAQKLARKFSGLIGDIGVKGAASVLKESGPRVTLDYYYRRPLGWQPPVGLIENWGDDMMVADVLAFTAGTGNAAALLTNDVGAYRTAEDHGVQVFFLRGKDHWQLANETDERDKEITKLKAENNELRRSSPNILLTVRRGNTEVSEIDAEIIQFPALDEEQVQQLMATLRERHPLVTDFSKPRSGLLGWDNPLPNLPGWMGGCDDQAPSEEEIQAYIASYAAWLPKAQTYLESLPERLNESPLEISADFLLSNNGTVPAEEVILKFEALGDLLLDEQASEGSDDKEGEDDSDSKNNTGFPEPPTPPEWRRVPRKGHRSILDQLYATDSLHAKMAKVLSIETAMPDFSFSRSSERVPQHFYWREKPRAPSSTWCFTCEDFRHQAPPEEFPARVLLPRIVSPTGRGGIRVRLSARNMPIVFEKVVPVKTTVCWGDTKNEALKCLPRRNWRWRS